MGFVGQSSSGELCNLKARSQRWRTLLEIWHILCVTYIVSTWPPPDLWLALCDEEITYEPARKHVVHRQTYQVGFRKDHRFGSCSTAQLKRHHCEYATGPIKLLRTLRRMDNMYSSALGWCLRSYPVVSKCRRSGSEIWPNSMAPVKIILAGFRRCLNVPSWRSKSGVLHSPGRNLSGNGKFSSPDT